MRPAALGPAGERRDEPVRQDAVELVEIRLEEVGHDDLPRVGALVPADALESAGIAWGIVTNKSQRFTLPLMDALGYARRAACIVSGDSSPRAKPHAHPMLLACTLAGTPPSAGFFVGDDIRDIAAGRAAGMRTIAASYGYLGDGGPVATWGADHDAAHPGDIHRFVLP